MFVIGLLIAVTVINESAHRYSQGSAADAVGIATAEMAVDMVQDAVKKITPHIPQLVAHTLAEEMQSPEMKTAFENLRSEMKQKKSIGLWTKKIRSSRLWAAN